MLRLIPLVFRNVLRNRRRSLLTLASSAVSLALLALLIAIYQGFFYGEDRVPSDALRIITRHRVSLTQVLPASHQARIAAVPGVEAVSAWTWFQGTYIEPQNFFARFAVDADTIFAIRQDAVANPDEIKAFQGDRAGCAIARAIADKHKLKVGDKMQIVGDIYPVTLDLTVRAVFEHPPGSDFLMFHREYLTELLPAKSNARDTAGTFISLAKSPDLVPRISKAVDAMFENSPYPTRTESEKEFGRSFLSFLGNIKLFLAAVCGAVTFTILLVSANTVAMAARERTREIAILRTLGYTPGEILGLVVSESIVISLLGGVVGVGLGWLLAASISDFTAGFGIQGVKWQAAAIVMALAALIGLLAAVVPAITAARANLVESLRFTG